MDLIGLVGNIYEAVIHINSGRKSWAIRGKEQEGRISYEEGIDLASATFKEAQALGDPKALILVEYTFICQELQSCSESDNDTLSSLKMAKQSFDDAFLALQVVEDSTIYQGVDKAFPHRNIYRINGFPKDAFHIACIAHKTRIQNILRSPGIDPIEKTLLKQRHINLSTAQNGYTIKQKKSLI